MDIFKGYTTAVAKSQTRCGLFLFVVTLTCSILMTVKMSDWYSKDKTAFQCKKTDETGDTINAPSCYEQYSNKYNSPFSQMTFALVNCFTIVGLWVMYAIHASPRIRRYVRQYEMRQNMQDTSLGLFFWYEIHIFLRVAFLGVMIVVLLRIQTFRLPGNDFKCSLEHVGSNTTKVFCTDTNRSEKSNANIAMLAFDGALLLLSAVEGFYLPLKIRSRARSRHCSMNDAFISYLIDETAEDGPSLTLDEYFRRIKQDVLDYTESEKALFPNAESGTMKMDDIYTNVVMQHGRANWNLHGMERPDVFATYTEPTDVEAKDVGDIFRLNENARAPPRTILVTGKAGIGKSLFCHKLLREWAKDDVFSRNFNANFDRFKFVSILKFKEINNLKTNLALYDLLRASMILSNLGREVYEYIIQHPDQLLVLFDGLDEFDHYRSCTKDEQSYINDVNQKMPVSALYGKLMMGKFLKGATIITTSRPAALYFVADFQFERAVEILGFSPNQVQEYIERFCGNDQAMCEAINRHVFDNENILSFCYVPVNCMLTCSYLKYKLSTGALVQDSPVLPTTLTEMYVGVLRMFTVRHNHHCRVEEVQHLPNFSVLVGETLRKLCDLAMEGIREGKLTFLRSDLVSYGLSGNDIEQLTDSGFLHCLPGVRSGPFEVDTQYSFIHLTVQEFLAAHRVQSKLSTKDISTSVLLGTHWDLVLQFYCGLKDTDPEEMRIILHTLLRSSPDPDQESSDLIDNDSSSADSIKVQVDSSDTRPSTPLFSTSSPCSPFLEYGEVAKKNLRRSGHKIRLIDTDRIRSKCEMQLLAIKCLYEAQNRPIIREIRRICFPSERVDLSGLGITPGDCPAIKYFLLETSEVETRVLRMQNNNVRASGCKTLAELFAVGAGPTKVLDISNNFIGDNGATCMSQALTTVFKFTPTSLNLSQNGITAAGVNGVAEAFFHSSQLQELNMGYNKLGADGAGAISTLLRSPWCAITQLGLAGNAIGDAGVAQVRSALLCGSFTLVDLDLRSNEITSNGCSSVADVLSHPQCSVETLALSGNPLYHGNPDGLRKLANSIGMVTSQIRSLLLSDCGIHLEGIVFLSEALANKCCKVKNIDLSSNQIGDAGCRSLSVIALPCCHVEDINLDRNEINDAGAKCLLRALENPNCRLRSLSLCDNNISPSLEVELLNAWGEQRGGLYLI